MPLWAAHCLRRIRVPQNVVSLQRARRCGLRVALSHPNAAECRLPAARAPLWAACCHPNTECRGSAVRAQLWAAHCLCRIRVPQNGVAPQCVRRCGLRIAFDASECQDFRRIRTPKKFCSASAAVGRALPWSHPYAHASRKHDDK